MTRSGICDIYLGREKRRSGAGCTQLAVECSVEEPFTRQPQDPCTIATYGLVNGSMHQNISLHFSFQMNLPTYWVL